MSRLEYVFMYGMAILGSVVAYFYNNSLGAGLLAGFAIGYFVSDIDTIQFLRVKQMRGVK